MKLPQSWKEVQTYQYKLLNELNEESFGSLFLYNIEVISILTDNDIEEFDDTTTEEFSSYMSQLKWLRKEPSKNFKRKIDKYTFKDLNKVSLGEFIDLEHYFKIDYIANIDKVCSILYKQTKLDEWGNTIFEPYTYDINERLEVFEEVCIEDIYGVVTDYIKFRDNFLSIYENLFKPNIEATEEDIEAMDEEDKKSDEEDEASSRWSWESIIYNFCNGDLTKVDRLTDLPLILVFNMISMRQDLET